MLKLTDQDTRRPVYIAPTHISLIEDLDNGSKIWLTSNVEQRVTETPEHILAMPEMVMLHNPMFMLGPGK